MTRRRMAAVLVAVTIVGASCGARPRLADNPSLVATAPTTPTSTAVASTAATSTTAAEAVTSAPAATTAPAAPEPVTTTTTVALPTPEPPPDEQAVEAADQLGRLEIPKLGLDLAFFEGVALPTLDKGPGHWPGTAMPGEVGNVVIAGHRVSHSRPFRNIDKLVEGDELVFTVAGVRTTYVVVGTQIVTPDAIEIVDQTPDRTATLFACHPPGSTQFRWVTHLRVKP